MKKIVAFLAAVMVLGLAACGSEEKGWTDKDFIVKCGDEEIEIKKEMIFYGFDGICYLDDYAAAVDGDEDYEAYYEGEVSTNRGLKPGMDMKEFLELYDVKEEYAVWEIVSGEEGEWTQFAPYDAKQDMDELYDEFSSELYPNAWLDIGFYKDGDKWIALKDVEVQDVWFCESENEDFEEVAILSVNFDDDGEIGGISLSYIKNDSTWETWQGWN